MNRFLAIALIIWIIGLIYYIIEWLIIAINHYYDEHNINDNDKWFVYHCEQNPFSFVCNKWIQEWLANIHIIPIEVVHDFNAYFGLPRNSFFGIDLKVKSNFVALIGFILLLYVIICCSGIKMHRRRWI